MFRPLSVLAARVPQLLFSNFDAANLDALLNEKKRKELLSFPVLQPPSQQAQGVPKVPASPSRPAQKN